MSNVAASNFTSLYSANASPVVPAMPYGDANVVTLLNQGTVAGNTVGNIDAAGNITAGGVISATGNITTDGFFVGDFAGNITGNITVPGSNTQVLFNNNGNAGASAGFTFNSATNAAVITGNVTAQYFVGNGSQLTGIAADYGNANVAAYLPTYTGNLVSMTGNVTTTANISGAYILGNGSQLTGLPESYGNANVAAYLPTYTGNLASLTGNVTTTANISGAYILGNGSQLTGLPASYGNANVAAYLPTYTGDLNPGNITAAGNITGNLVANSVYASQTAGLIVNGPAGPNTGNLVAGNINAVNRISASGNIVSAETVSAAFFTAGGNLTMTGTPGTYGFITATSNIKGANLQANTNITAGGDISAVGNITGNYFVGNGSLLTGIVGSYGNANVAAYLPTYTGNLASLAGNVTTTANVQGNYILGNGSQLTGIVSSYGNANVAAYLPDYNGNIGVANITTNQDRIRLYGRVDFNGLDGTFAAGNIFGGNLNIQNLTQSGTITASGDISTVGNVIAGYFLGNGSQLSGVPSADQLSQNLNVNGYRIQAVGGGNVAIGNTVAGSTGNVNVDTVTTGQIKFTTNTVNVQAATFSASGNANITGNITTSGRISSTGNIQTAGNVDAAGNITAAIGITAALGTITGELQVGGISSTGVGIFGSNVDVSGRVSAGGNVQGGNLVTGGRVTATGNLVTSAQVVATGNITGGNILTGGIVSATGNLVTAAQVVATGNITSSGNIAASYFIGNGSQLTGISSTVTPAGSNTQVQYNNAGALGAVSALTFDNATGNIQAGNVVFNLNGAPSQINNIQEYSSATGSNPGRILIGPGYFGDTTNSADFVPRTRAARVAIWGAHEQGNETVQSTGLTVQESVKLTASTDANLNSRNFAISGILQLGGQNLYNFQQTLALALGSQGGITVVGTSGNSAPGNTTVSNASGAAGAVQVQSGSTLTAGTGFVSAAVNAGGTLTNFNAFAPTTVYVAGTAPSSYNVLYNPSSSTVNGVVNANQYRAAAEYYFLKNDDNAAQVRLGSLRRYNEFNYTSNSTSGNITIDKNNAQVQTIVPTGAITIDGFSNFVTSASDGTNSDPQTDTVTIIIAQGATGYAVNLPASSSTVKYAGGVSTVGTGANTVTMISVTAVNIGGSDTYLLTLSPEFQ